MGANHARVVSESLDADLNIVIDSSIDAASALADEHQVRVGIDLDDAMRADAVVVAAATDAHFEIAVPFIEAGIPVLVEKPFAGTLADVERLLEVAARHDTPVMCGLVERFNAAFVEAVRQVGGTPRHVVTMRHSPPAVHIRSSVVPDLLLHDLDATLLLFDAYDTRAELVGASLYRPDGAEFDEIADCVLEFPDGLATLSVDRLGQRKVRTMSIQGPDRLVEVDLLRQSVTVYRHVSEEMIGAGEGYRSSTEIDIPFIRHVGEPLALQFSHFMSMVEGRVDHVAERSRIHASHGLMDRVMTEGARTERTASSWRG